MATTINHTATHPTTGETFTRSSTSRTYTHAVIITRAPFSSHGHDYPEARWAEWTSRETLAHANASRHRASGHTAVVVEASSSTHTTQATKGSEQGTITRKLNKLAESLDHRRSEIARCDRLAAEVRSGVLEVPSGYARSMDRDAYAAMWDRNADQAVENLVYAARTLWHLAIQRRRLVGEQA
jgi:hypothetical protein